MNDKNYRNTGMTKEECQAQVDRIIEAFKRNFPGEPVPVALEHWVENIATEEDVEFLRKRMHEEG